MGRQERAVHDLVVDRLDEILVAALEDEAPAHVDQVPVGALGLDHRLDLRVLGGRGVGHLDPELLRGRIDHGLLLHGRERAAPRAEDERAALARAGRGSPVARIRPAAPPRNRRRVIIVDLLVSVAFWRRVAWLELWPIARQSGRMRTSSRPKPVLTVSPAGTPSRANRRHQRVAGPGARQAEGDQVPEVDDLLDASLDHVWRVGRLGAEPDVLGARPAPSPWPPPGAPAPPLPGSESASRARGARPGRLRDGSPDRPGGSTRPRKPATKALGRPLVELAGRAHLLEPARAHDRRSGPTGPRLPPDRA